MLACADLAAARDAAWMTVAGMVLVRQRPGSAKGVTFTTVEEETGVDNLIVWTFVFERQRRLVLSVRMLACRGWVQREGEEVRVVAHRLEDLTDLLRSVEGRGGSHPAPDTHVPGPKPGNGIRVPTRDFR